MQEKGQLAYEVIKKKIITGELAPLSDISEKKLQEELGTSRTPVHEAIARLRDENFVYTFPRKGTFVTDITVETVRAVYEMRLLNEPYLTRHAIGSVPREWLEDILYRLGHWSEEMDLAEKNAYFQGLDTELHTTIASYNENIFLRNGLRNVYDHDQRIRIKRRKEKAVDEDGALGILTGGLTASAAGITAAVIFGLLASLIFKPKDK